MSQLIIFGVGEAAELAHFYFSSDTARRVVAFCVDSAYIRDPHFQGLPVLAPDEAVRAMPPATHDCFVAIGYSRLNQVRAGRCAAMKALGYRLSSYVSSRAITFPDLVCGDNAFIMENAVLQPRVRIGNHVTIWSGAHVAHHSVIGDNAFLAPRVALAGRVTVGEGSFLGINATVRDHVRIGRRCVVGAGAVVLADTPDFTLLGATAAIPAPLDPARL